jgi:hypothetical protein
LGSGCPIHGSGAVLRLAAPFFSLMAMTPSESDRQAFVDLTTIVKVMGLTPGQRIKLAGLVAADRTLGGLRADGTMPLDVAIKFCQAAKNR